MKRRRALQHLAIATATLPLIPACDFESYPVYANIPIDKRQRKLIEQLSNIALPINDPAIVTPEKTVDYILTVLNDCYSPEDIEKYLAGLLDFHNLVKEKYRRNLLQLKPEQEEALFAELLNEENNSESLNYFFNETFGLTQHHFTTSEFFMTNYLDFEFVPGRYIGCQDV